MTTYITTTWCFLRDLKLRKCFNNETLAIYKMPLIESFRRQIHPTLASKDIIISNFFCQLSRPMSSRNGSRSIQKITTILGTIGPILFIMSLQQKMKKQLQTYILFWTFVIHVVVLSSQSSVSCGRASAVMTVSKLHFRLRILHFLTSSDGTKVISLASHDDRHKNVNVCF